MNETEQALIEAIQQGDLKKVNALANDRQIQKEELKDDNVNPAIYVALIAIKSSQSEKEQQNQMKIFKRLLKSGYPIDKANAGGNTPLHKATKKQLIEAVKELINKGCDVNARNNDGETPLFFAVQAGNLELFETILNAPTIDPYIKVNSPIFGGKALDIREVLWDKSQQTTDKALKEIHTNMQGIFQKRVKRLNLKVVTINTLPVTETNHPDYENLIDKINNGQRHIFVSYCWSKKSYGTVPMVEDFCSYMDEKDIHYYRDSHSERGIQKIGNRNIETFMRTAAENSHITVAFINKHYLTSRNCLFELSLFWNGTSFNPNLYIVMHPEFNEAYSDNDSKEPKKLKDYIDSWSAKLNKFEQNDKAIPVWLKGVTHVSEAMHLNNVARNFPGMMQHLADHVWPSYQELRTSGYKDIFKEALIKELPEKSEKARGSVIDKIGHFESKIKEELIKVQNDFKQKHSTVEKKFEDETKKIKSKQDDLQKQIDELKEKERNLNIQSHQNSQVTEDQQAIKSQISQLQKQWEEAEKSRKQKEEEYQKAQNQLSEEEKVEIRDLKIKIEAQKAIQNKQNNDNAAFKASFEQNQTDVNSQLEELQTKIKTLEKLIEETANQLGKKANQDDIEKQLVVQQQEIEISQQKKEQERLEAQKKLIEEEKIKIHNLRTEIETQKAIQDKQSTDADQFKVSFEKSQADVNSQFEQLQTKIEMFEKLIEETVNQLGKKANQDDIEKQLVVQQQEIEISQQKKEQELLEAQKKLIEEEKVKIHGLKNEMEAQKAIQDKQSTDADQFKVSFEKSQADVNSQFEQLQTKIKTFEKFIEETTKQLGKKANQDDIEKKLAVQQQEIEISQQKKEQERLEAQKKLIEEEKVKIHGLETEIEAQKANQEVVKKQLLEHIEQTENKLICKTDQTLFNNQAEKLKEIDEKVSDNQNQIEKLSKSIHILSPAPKTYSYQVRQKALEVADKITPKEVKEMMRAAENAELETVEKMLRENPYLVYAQADVNEVNESMEGNELKTYRNLTLFQYVWVVGNIVMCDMVMKYLNYPRDKEAATQVMALEQERSDIVLAKRYFNQREYDTYTKRKNEMQHKITKTRDQLAAVTKCLTNYRDNSEKDILFKEVEEVDEQGALELRYGLKSYLFDIQYKEDKQNLKLQYIMMSLTNKINFYLRHIEWLAEGNVGTGEIRLRDWERRAQIKATELTDYRHRYRTLYQKQISQQSITIPSQTELQQSTS